MARFFTYMIRNGNKILRIGKGHCSSKTKSGIVSYIVSRYGTQGWTTSAFYWHSSEAAALKKETELIDEYLFRRGVLPPWNRRRGGGGRQIYVKCKAATMSGKRCLNDALEENHSYCGVHRRLFSQ